jgi:hypothetical protein
VAFFHSLGLEPAVPIAGHVDVKLRGLGVDRLLALALAAISQATPVPGMGRIAEVLSQFGFQRTRNEPGGQLPE